MELEKHLSIISDMSYFRSRSAFNLKALYGNGLRSAASYLGFLDILDLELMKSVWMETHRVQKTCKAT